MKITLLCYQFILKYSKADSILKIIIKQHRELYCYNYILYHFTKTLSNGERKHQLDALDFLLEVKECLRKDKNIVNY